VGEIGGVVRARPSMVGRRCGVSVAVIRAMEGVFAKALCEVESGGVLGAT
jgi:hypothetical protein